MHPLIIAGLLGATVGLFGLGLAWFLRRSAERGIVIAISTISFIPSMLLVIALNPWLIDSRFRTYRSFYKKIDIGMTREEVLSELDRQYPSGSPRKRPSIMQDDGETLGFFMNPETSREPNCEGIFLTFEGGRIAKKHYSPD